MQVNIEGYPNFGDIIPDEYVMFNTIIYDDHNLNEICVGSPFSFPNRPKARYQMYTRLDRSAVTTGFLKLKRVDVYSDEPEKLPASLLLVINGKLCQGRNIVFPPSGLLHVFVYIHLGRGMSQGMRCPGTQPNHLVNNMIIYHLKELNDTHPLDDVWSPLNVNENVIIAAFSNINEYYRGPSGIKINVDYTKDALYKLYILACRRTWRLADRCNLQTYREMANLAYDLEAVLEQCLLRKLNNTQLHEFFVLEPDLKEFLPRMYAAARVAGLIFEPTYGKFPFETSVEVWIKSLGDNFNVFDFL